jgi:hypothetical protein
MRKASAADVEPAAPISSFQKAVNPEARLIKAPETRTNRLELIHTSENVQVRLVIRCVGVVPHSPISRENQGTERSNICYTRVNPWRQFMKSEGARKGEIEPRYDKVWVSCAPPTRTGSSRARDTY